MNVPTVNPNSVQGFSSQPSWATHQPVQCGRQEFRVIYDATAISIHVLERREVKRQNWGCSQKLVVSNLGKTQLCHGISQSYLYFISKLLMDTYGMFGHGHDMANFDLIMLWKNLNEETLGCTVPTGAWDMGCLSPTTLLQLIFHPLKTTPP